MGDRGCGNRQEADLGHQSRSLLLVQQIVVQKVEQGVFVQVQRPRNRLSREGRPLQRCTTQDLLGYSAVERSSGIQARRQQPQCRVTQIARDPAPYVVGELPGTILTLRDYPIMFPGVPQALDDRRNAPGQLMEPARQPALGWRDIGRHVLNRYRPQPQHIGTPLLMQRMRQVHRLAVPLFRQLLQSTWRLKGYQHQQRQIALDLRRQVAQHIDPQIRRVLQPFQHEYQRLTPGSVSQQALERGRVILQPLTLRRGHTLKQVCDLCGQAHPRPAGDARCVRPRLRQV